MTHEDGRKYPIASFRLTPEMAIVDPEFAQDMPLPLLANSGIDAVRNEFLYQITHAIESYVSVVSSDYTKALSLQALKMLVDNLPVAYENRNNLSARDQVMNGSTIAGMAFANAFLGDDGAMNSS